MSSILMTSLEARQRKYSCCNSLLFKPLWRCQIFLALGLPSAYPPSELRRKLEEHRWNVSRTAATVGLHRQSLQEKLRELGIQRPGKAPAEAQSRGGKTPTSL